MKQTISLLVENRAGVLYHITSLFSKRAFNIESLAVGMTEDPTLSRITLVVDSGNNVVEQVEKQLNKLVDVVKVRTLSESTMIGRELLLIKVNANASARNDLMTICSICGAKVVDITPTTVTMQIADTAEMVESFREMMRSYGILEVATTGMVALRKGAGKL